MRSDGERADALRREHGKGPSISLSLRADAVTSLCPRASAASRISVISDSEFGLDGSNRKPNVAVAGTSSLSKLSRFDPSALAKKVTPVTLPLGRARLATSPTLIGSAPT